MCCGGKCSGWVGMGIADPMSEGWGYTYPLWYGTRHTTPMDGMTDTSETLPSRNFVGER